MKPLPDDEMDTPETDAFEAVLRKMRELKRERNAAVNTLKEIRELFTADEAFGDVIITLFAKPLEEAEKEIARLQSLIP